LEDFIQKIKTFIKSTDFSKAVLLGITLSLPIFIGITFDIVQVATVITVGAMLASPSDISGSTRQKSKGILLSMGIAVTISVIGGNLHFLTWLKIPVIALLVFGISYISVFGFRASLVSFSGLFALVLSFSPVSGNIDPFERSLWIGIGGLWYLSMSLLWHVLFPKGPTEFYLSKTLSLTSEYLKIRGNLASKENDREELFRRLLIIQTELTETHETLRGILISTRTGSGQSIYEGKRLLIFALLIDMLELAMAHPVNYKKTDNFFRKNPQHLLDFQHLLFEMSRRLEEISHTLSDPKKLSKTSRLSEFLHQVEQDINQYSNQNDLNDEDLSMLRNLYKYQAEQTEKIQKIEWLLIGTSTPQVSFIKNEEARKFLTKESYDFNILIENLNPASPIFRHSARMAVVTIIGFALGEFLELQNSYWILLTIIVIMRPSFGLTKQRSRERTIGTLIGGVLAVGIVFWIKNPWTYGILAIITLIISFSMIQRNYKAAATFITLSVVFSYALITPDVFNVIQYRVTDTLIGTGLAVMGNLFLWPAWEIQNIQKTLCTTIAANRKYFAEIANFYKEKITDPSALKISRKKAFIEMSNLSAAFQRMTQEPKSQQKNMEQVYEIVVLNHTFLASLASVSTYITNHPITSASKNFEKVSDAIVANMIQAETILDEGKSKNITHTKETEDIFDLTYGRNNKIVIHSNDKEEHSAQLEEAYLVREQLKWLLAMSKKMPLLVDRLPLH